MNYYFLNSFRSTTRQFVLLLHIYLFFCDLIEKIGIRVFDAGLVWFIRDLGQVLLQVYFLSLRVMHIVDPSIMSSRKRFAISANVECVFMDMVY